jgi:hypothetical protein
MNTAKSLTEEAPRSPRNRLGGYSLMARMIDKGRADLAGNVMLFEFKGVQAEEVKKLLASGATDAQIVNWFDTHGTTKSAEEIKSWSDGVEGYRPFEDPEKKEWFSGECSKLGLKPESSTLVDYLEADDAISFKK